MRVFLTGATGFIGSRIVPELIAAGHKVIGLTRSDSGEVQLREAGAVPHRGTLEQPETLAAGAAMADAVIHTAFDHDFSRFVENCQKDARAIHAMGEMLVGTDKPFIITSGTRMGGTASSEPSREDVVDWEHANPRSASERAGADLLEKGASVAVVRLPQVHDTARQGLISPLTAIAIDKGISGYLGTGANRWPAASVVDVARLYQLALKHHRAGARWHAVAEEGVSAKAIAEVLAEGLGVPAVSIAPDDAPGHFGWMAMFAGLDMPASSAQTREALGWQPTGPDLLSDLRAMDYVRWRQAADV